MQLRKRYTLEIAAPPDRVLAALRDQRFWPALLPGLHRNGEYWRFGGELYRLHAHSIGERFVVQAAHVAAPRSTLLLSVQLASTGITSRVQIDLVATLPLWPWLAARRQFAGLLREAAALLEGELATQAAPAHEPFPKTAAAFRAMGAEEHLKRIAQLDASWAALRQQQPGQAAEAPALHTTGVHVAAPAAFDLIYAGGGLGLLHAAVMAQRYGQRVLLFDRSEVGAAHREWNISRVELAALVASGLCSWPELAPVIMNEYERGVVRFHHGGAAASELWLPTVLNVALDAGALLRLARRKLEAAGGMVLDRRVLRGVQASASGPMQVRVELEAADGSREQYTARLLLDGMGSTSPLAAQRYAGQPFAGVCPTVGTVVRGLVPGEAADQHNPQIGDILLSVEHAQRGQQYMWEGFPGRGDELTVYLFYYDTLAGPQRSRETPPSLLQLFEDYFTLLPTYKQPGPDFAHLKPVYGYIPARHSMRQREAPLLRGVLPIGDSAAQQSPLTFCGFGSHVRNLGRTTSLLAAALAAGLLEPGQLQPISAYQANVSLNWVFSRFMQPWGQPDDVNRLQNVFLQVLNDLGVDLAQRFFQDRMRWSDYHQMILGMFFRYPRIVLDAWRVLGAAGCRQWIADYARYCAAALSAAGANALGSRGRAALLAVLGRWPGAALRVRAAFAEWWTSGWLETPAHNHEEIATISL